MEQDNNRLGKKILVKIVKIVAFIASISTILGFVLNVYDRDKEASSNATEPSDDSHSTKDVSENNNQKKRYKINDGKIIFVQETEIVLRVKNNEEFVVTDDRGYLQGKASEINSNSIYKIHNTPDNYSGLQGEYGFVRVAADEENAPIYENADEIQSWECYEFFKHNEYVCIKCQANGNYITCVLDEDGNRLYARGEEVQEWELFSVYIREKDKWKNIFTDEEIEF